MGDKLNPSDLDAIKQANRPSAETELASVNAMEDLNKRILEKRMENMASMKPFYAERKEIVADARANGIHGDALKELVADRALLRKIKEKIANLDETAGEELRIMRENIGLFDNLPISRKPEPITEKTQVAPKSPLSVVK